MSCTVIVLSDNNLTCASGTFGNVFREKIYQFKAKDSEIIKYPCVEEIFQEIFQLIT